MNDKVFIEGLTVITTIGIYDWEKTIKQKLVIDVDMAWDNRPAGQSDDVNFCLDYAKISQAIVEKVQNQAFGLIERVAEEIASLLMKDFSVPWVKVKVSKPSAIASASNVGVVIERKI